MKKIRWLIVMVMFFVTPFMVKAAIQITIVSPKSTGLYNDNLKVELQIISDSTVKYDTIRATVGDRSVLLYRDPFYRYVGFINLSGLPQGELQLDVYVKDSAGNIATANTKFIFDSLPTVVIESPIADTTYITKMRIKASVKDPGNINCSGKIFYADAAASTFVKTINFVNSIDTLVDAPPTGHTEALLSVSVIATDSKGQSVRMDVYNIIGINNPLLIEAYIGKGQIVDFKDNRILMSNYGSDNITRYKIVNILDGTVENIKLNTVSQYAEAVVKLCNNGAIIGALKYDFSSYADTLYLWRDNKLINLTPGSIDISRDFHIAGDKLLWHASNNKLNLTDLVSLQTINIDSTNYFDADVSPDGDVAYRSGNNIFKYGNNTKATQQITHDSLGQTINSGPHIEKKNIAFMKSTNGTNELYLNDGLKEYNVGVIKRVVPQMNSVDYNYDSNRYRLADGYLFFNNYSGNAEQIFVRTPDNVIKQLSSFEHTEEQFNDDCMDCSQINTAGSGGSVLFSHPRKRYYSDNLTPVKNVSDSYGTTYFVNDSFYLALGSTLLKYNIDVPPPSFNIISMYPDTAAAGTAVNITGNNFTSATGVEFGGVPAASFKVISNSTITAIVGAGSSGYLTVKQPSRIDSLAGFTFIPSPIITSINPAASGAGSTITINGNNFNKVTAVSLGGIAATGFTVVSATQIQAIVGSGASGTVSVNARGGVGSFAGFTFIPTPSIITDSITSILTGGSIILTANTGTGYNYKWTRNGTDIDGANGSIYTAIDSGSYTVSILSGSSVITSPAIHIKTNFSLPSTNFTITTTDKACKTSDNTGSIMVQAAKVMDYTVTVKENGIGTISKRFTDTVTINNLSAATYEVCITVEGQPGYKQCFNAVIDEPKDLSVFTAVNQTKKTLTLSLGGASLYNVELNGASYTTSKDELTLNLRRGNNLLKVYTGIACQGIVEKQISVTDDMILYPNPFENILTISIGDDTSKMVAVEVRTLFGEVVFKGKLPNEYGNVRVDLSNIKSGVHVLKLRLDTSENTFKIIKK